MRPTANGRFDLRIANQRQGMGGCRGRLPQHRARHHEPSYDAERQQPLSPSSHCRPYLRTPARAVNASAGAGARSQPPRRARRRAGDRGARDMALKTARRAAVAPFYAMEVLRAANRREAAGARVLHLEVGEPAAGAPEPVRAAARQALEAGRIGYTEALGLPRLRARIARHYEERHGLSVDPAAGGGDDRRLGRLRAVVPRRVRRRRPRRPGGTGLPGVPQHSSQLRRRGRGARRGSRRALSADPGDAGRRRAARRRDRGEPVESDREHARRAGARGACRMVRRQRRAPDLR